MTGSGARSRWQCSAGGDHVFRHKDDYCIKCDRRIRGAGEPHRAPRHRTIDEQNLDDLETEPLRIDTSRTQDDYYDDAGLRESRGPDALTERALREVMGQ